MMASLQASTLLFSSSSSSSSSSLLPSTSSSLCCSSKIRINAAIHVPKLGRKVHISIPKLPAARNLEEELNLINGFTKSNILKEKFTTTTIDEERNLAATSMATAQLYAILEAVADRVEMNANIGEQRKNWNTLLLNSINMITLTAATMAGVAATAGLGMPLLALKLSSTLLFSAATGMSVVMNKIQPSQLVEEQRNATRLFRQFHGQIQNILTLRNPTPMDVQVTLEKVLALDQAYPLPLIGKMIEKFPKTFEPACWWPSSQFKITKPHEEKRFSHEKNGWSEELEERMREIVQVLKRKDAEDYMRLGKLALKLNKILAISGPLLTGIAAVGSAFMGSPNGSWAVIVAVVAGALASIVNTLEHGGQVGMVIEMYRNCAGFFGLLEESIESTLNERVEERENGELFEMKVAIQLGRSLSQLRDLAAASRTSRRDGSSIDEFASKLF